VKRGFSLIELMIVLILLAVMSAMTWPMLQKPLEKIKIKSEAQRVIKEFGEVKLKAMQDGECKLFRGINLYPDGSVDNGIIRIQQDKLNVDIKVNALLSSAKIGDCYYDERNIRVSEEQHESNSDELSK